MPLFEYYFQRIHKQTSLMHIIAVGSYWIRKYPEVYHNGHTSYRLDEPAPKNCKQPRRYKTEHWYAYLDVEREGENTIDNVFKLLSNLPFNRSINSRGEDIPPVPLPIKRPVGRPRKIVIPLRQIVVCHDLQLIAKLPGEII